ncbi:hypothetical protein [Devosia sp. CN2-171]|jgi:hypothetical protein|uniref:hypothetical protein n=1 Tax=Devosia sp. CN2-171 TaxID=3400909 RepID=UPI003BF7AA97
MRHLIATILLVLGFSGGAFAYDNPKALVEAIYQPYQSGQKPEGGLEQFYSAKLKGMYDAHREAKLSDVAFDPDSKDILSFDPFVEGGNALLLDVAISEPVINGDRAATIVTFHNFDHLSMLSLSLVREADGWKVDDVASLGGDPNWLLSWLLEYDPFGQN